MSSVFLCHSSEDKRSVEPIQLALANAGCEVFYDEQSLPPGGDYQARIRTAIRNCDVFVFIASAASIAPGRFTLTELKFARERWPSPVGRVLPVATAGFKPKDLPSYLQAATVLTVSGDTATEVRAAVEGMLREVRSKRLRRGSIAVGLGGAVLMATITAYHHLEQIPPLSQPQSAAQTASVSPTVWATGINGAVLFTRDAGQTWQSTTLSSQILSSVIFASANDGWIGGDKGTMLHTTDGGSNWTRQGNHEAWFSSVVFENNGEGWAVSGPEILHTEDAGNTWRVQFSNTDKWLAGLAFVTNQLGWAVGGDGIILHTENGGVSWHKQSIAPLTAGHLNAVAFVSQTEGWAVGSTILHTLD